LGLTIVEPEEIGESLPRNDWGLPDEKEGIEYARRSSASAIVIIDAEFTFEETAQVPLIGFLFRPTYHPVVEIQVAMYNSEAEVLWRDSAFARGNTARKINANWFFSEEPFDPGWPPTPIQLYMDALEQLMSQTVAGRTGPGTPSGQSGGG
jgi:hypothetical protein